MSKQECDDAWNELRAEFDRQGLTTAQRTLVLHGITYQDGTRPLEIWKAIRLCHLEKMPIPRWVADSLALIAFRMLDDPPEEKSARQRVFDATGIAGWEFGDNSRAIERIDLAIDIERISRQPYGVSTKGITRARTECAQNAGKSFRTIKDKHNKIKSHPDYEKMIKHYLRE